MRFTVKEKKVNLRENRKSVKQKTAQSSCTVFLELFVFA